MATIAYGRKKVRKESGANKGVFSRIQNYMVCSRAQRQLEQLDDRLLADIGLRRSEIQRMVWGN